MTEKDILGCALQAQKHLSHLYHATTEHVDDPSLLRELFSLMQEEQELRLQVYQMMHQRGWYSPRPIDDQQLQQAKNQFSSVRTRLQQQFQQGWQPNWQQSWQQTQPSSWQQPTGHGWSAQPGYSPSHQPQQGW